MYSSTNFVSFLHNKLFVKGLTSFNIRINYVTNQSVTDFGEFLREPFEIEK